MQNKQKYIILYNINNTCITQKTNNTNDCYKQRMGIYIVFFELLMIILYGVFIRTDTNLTTTIETSNVIYFIVAYTVTHFKYRLTDWSTLIHFLYITAITLQLNTLLTLFWYSSFLRSFSATTALTTPVLIIGFECCLAILVTYFHFIGSMHTVEVFVLCLVQVFAFSLNYSICLFGINTITGGGGMTIFVFAFLFTVPIRKLCYKAVPQAKERYFTLSMKILALVVVVATWPAFNSATSQVDTTYLTSLNSAANLSNEAYLHTLLALLSCIATSVGLYIFGEKIKINQFIQSIISTGILVSSSTSLIVDPFASLFLGLCGPLLCFLLDRYASSALVPGYSIDLIIVSVVGGILSAVFAAGRNNRTPTLVSSPLTQGGLQLACLFLSAALALLFGLCAALILRCLVKQGEECKDTSVWLIAEEDLPLYSDDPIFENILAMEKEKRLKQDSVLFSLKKSYLDVTVQGEEGQIVKHNLINL